MQIMTSNNEVPPLRILVINPNSSSSMTSALEPVVKSLPFPNVEFSFFTCPSVSGAISSINSPQDAIDSAEVCFPHILPLISNHDAFLVACYSHHPLVEKIRSEFSITSTNPKKYVTGIFESSVLTSLQILRSTQSFGIVSTGAIWSSGLTVAVNTFLGLDPPSSTESQTTRFTGVETTGLNATELHDLPLEEVQAKMKQATQRLLRRGEGIVGAICLGCAGMVGLDDAVREACVEELGKGKGEGIRIVDGVKAGIANLVGAARGDF